MMEEASRTPSFLIDIELWQKFNLELRAACHWCTHHHTTTPAEAAKQLERGEGWPRDWISRKVKNSTRQFGGLFICPAPDCAGHSNAKGERRRRWFCRFCINRHLGVDLKNFFQLDEVQDPQSVLLALPSKGRRGRVHQLSAEAYETSQASERESLATHTVLAGSIRSLQCCRCGVGAFGSSGRWGL